MNKYNNGKIYKIIDNTTNDIYIGSTIQARLSKRLRDHKSDCKNNKGASCSKIINNGDYKIILIEKYSCNSKDELLSREQHYIDKLDCVNKYKAIVPKNDKRKMKNDRQKVYRNKNRDAINKALNISYHFINSWGGDPRYHNNLSKISLDIFK